MSDKEQPVPEWFNPDRKRGMITSGDREFLARQTDEYDQASRNKRYRIRERVINSFYDFNDLRLLNKEDQGKIFEKLLDAGPTLTSTLEFVYAGITGDTERTGKVDTTTLEETLSAAAQQVEGDRGYMSNVKINIEVDRKKPDIEHITEKILEGEATNQEFIYYLQNSGPSTTLFKKLLERDEPLTITEDGEKRELSLESIRALAEFVDEDTDLEQ